MIWISSPIITNTLSARIDVADGSLDVSLGDTLAYTITATNDGDVTLSNVTVDDDPQEVATASERAGENTRSRE